MEPRAIRFGVSRSHGHSNLVEGARLLTAAIGAQLARPIRLVFADDYEGLLRMLRSATVEAAWMPPLLEARALAAGATVAVVCQRGGSLTYRAALLVRADSPHGALTHLQGARAAWGDRQSASSHRVPRLHLRAAGVTVGSEQFFGSPTAAMAAVIDGKADFCACHVSEAAGRTPERALEDLRQSFTQAPWRLRVLDVTEPIPPDGIVIARHTGEHLTRLLTERLLWLHRSTAGVTALRVLFGAERLTAPSEPVLQTLARLGDVDD